MAKKANGKAKEASLYDVGLIPVNGNWKLTPARAKRWLKDEHGGFQVLATMGLRYAKDEEDRDAFVWLAHNIKTMVDACLEALSGAPSVVVFSDVGGPCGDGSYRFNWMGQALRLLRIPSLAREDAVEWGDSEFNAFDALVRIVERYVKEASRLEDQATEAAMRRRNAEREANGPRVRLGKILDRREALEEERDAAEPWARRLEYLQYEEALLLNEFSGCSAVHPHPGKPPKGYESQTLGNPER